jgi:thiol-disulfide isomerase/thioredoxin
MGIRQTLLILGLFIPLSGALTAQPYIIQGNIEHSDQGMIYLASYYGDRFRVADSMENSEGSFHFLLSGDVPAGIYRLVYTEVDRDVRTVNRFVEFIYNRGDMTFNVSAGENGPIPYFENNLENQVYFDFMTFELEYEARLMKAYGQLFPALPGDPDYDSAVRQYEWLQVERNRYMDSVSSLYPGLYATKIMKAFRAPVVAGSISHDERIDVLKQVFFEKAPIDDPSLLYAPVYTFRLVDYLSLYRVDTLTRQAQEDQFIEAVDQIMANVSPDPELRSFVVEFMLEGFEMLGMEKVQIHLADHYLDQSCESDIVELVRSRMQGYREMAEGATAPDFVIRDIRGKNHRLSTLPNPYTLVVFWSSTCEHCHELLPELHDWYLHENTPDLEVVAISVDTLEAAFEDYAGAMKMQWITARDPLGWVGRLPADYHVYATPSMFLLDRERTILSRPVNFRQFQRAVSRLQPSTRVSGK